jgi:hypothetical protein
MILITRMPLAVLLAIEPIGADAQRAGRARRPRRLSPTWKATTRKRLCRTPEYVHRSFAQWQAPGSTAYFDALAPPFNHSSTLFGVNRVHDRHQKRSALYGTQTNSLRYRRVRIRSRRHNSQLLGDQFTRADWNMLLYGLGDIAQHEKFGVPLGRLAPIVIGLAIGSWPVKVRDGVTKIRPGHPEHDNFLKQYNHPARRIQWRPQTHCQRFAQILHRLFHSDAVWTAAVYETLPILQELRATCPSGTRDANIPMSTARAKSRKPYLSRQILLDAKKEVVMVYIRTNLSNSSRRNLVEGAIHEAIEAIGDRERDGEWGIDLRFYERPHCLSLTITGPIGAWYKTFFARDTVTISRIKATVKDEIQRRLES